MTFPPAIAEVMIEMPTRAIAKFVGCGYRLSAQEVDAQAEPGALSPLWRVVRAGSLDDMAYAHD